MRHLDIGGTISRVFQYYGSTARVLLPAAALVFIPVAVVELLAASASSALLVVIFIVVSLLASVWYQGMVVKAVEDMRDGRRDFGIGDLFRAAAPFVGPLLMAGILVGFGVFLGFVALIVPGLILLTFWSVTAPAIVLEDLGAVEGMRRSWRLVRGNGWQVFAVIVVMYVLLLVAYSILSAIGSAISSDVGRAVGSFITSIAIAPLIALAASVIYFELRDVRGAAPAAPEAPAAWQPEPPVPPVSPEPGARTGSVAPPSMGGPSEPAPARVFEPPVAPEPARPAEPEPESGAAAGGLPGEPGESTPRADRPEDEPEPPPGGSS